MKYIFFDIDGTLVESRDGESYISESTKKTIKQLKENGHLVALASGRSMKYVLPVAKELDIDNIVSDGGYGVMSDGVIKHIDPIDATIKNKLSQELIDKHIPFAFMVDSTTRELKATTQMLNHKVNVDFESIGIIIDDDFDFIKTDAFKIFMEIHVGEEDCIETVDAHRIMRYYDNCLAYEPDDKYQGVKEIVELHHGNIDDVVFFGDGLNDIIMAEKIPMSIAMGNAVDELKEIAYFITKSIDEDGVEYACRYFNFI